MNEPIRFQEVAEILKRLLKQKGITYKELAKKLSLSESGIKKLFISDDCSFSRLNEICVAIGVSISDVLDAVYETPIKSHRHTREQEEFLVSNPKAFNIYCKLTVEEMSITELKRNFKISESELFKILKSLDKYDLIQLMPEGRIRFPDKSMTLWENAGPLVAKMKREWPAQLLKTIIGNENLPGYRLALRSYRMKESTLKEFIDAITEIEFEFARRGYRETQLERENTILVSNVNALAPRSFIEKL